MIEIVEQKVTSSRLFMYTTKFVEQANCANSAYILSCDKNT